MPSAITVIKHDHRAIEDCYALYEKARTEARKRKIAEELLDILEAHSATEEKIFYPRVRRESDKKHKDLVGRAAAEHRQLKALVRELRKMEEPKAFAAGVKELMDMVAEHVEEEEETLLPHVDDLFGRKRLAELGEALERHALTS